MSDIENENLVFRLGRYGTVILPKKDLSQAWEKVKKMMEIYFEKPERVVPEETKKEENKK